MSTSYPDRRLFSLCCWLVLLTGCAGYQLGAGTLYRPDIQTVYVPVFLSESLRRDLGERLTEAVAKQIEAETPYKVVGSPVADSTLTGRILTHQRAVVAENRFDEPRDLELLMAVEIQWVDRYGQPLIHGLQIPMPLSLVETEHLIPESGQSVVTTQQRIIDDLAEQIVAQMQVPW